MGVGVSNWRLARAVSRAGHLGVVSGTAIDSVMVRRLQLGDPDGDVRRALGAFPAPDVAERVISRYFVAGGKLPGERFARTSMRRENPSRDLEDLLVAANFVEVHLAKEGHDGIVGINYLEKVQAPTLPSIYGAMLADVDYVLMGAGIPKAIPAVIDRLAEGLAVEMKLDVKGAAGNERFFSRFDPATAVRAEPRAAPAVKRPAFIAIVSSHVLASMLATKIDVPVDGFVVEAPTAGGHNAPPRGRLQLNEAGEPVYGERDVPDLDAVRALGLPFWLAGGIVGPEGVRRALDLGAAGVQVGTPFAYCSESAFAADVKRRVLELCRRSEVQVLTDPLASPSGFPFKVLQLDGTLSDPQVHESRSRTTCELGYLRTAYRRDDGRIAWRCPAEPVGDHVRKGGSVEETVGRKCLCNALLANVGLGQIRPDGTTEPMLVTSGDSAVDLARFISPGADTYTAADVIHQLLPDG